MKETDSSRCYAQAIAEGLTPDPTLTVSQWAELNRFLSSKSSAEPGRWRNERTPYLTEIMDCLSVDSEVEEVVFMKGAQIGGPLDLRTPLPTPSGWTTMGDIRVGDQVFDENGVPCRVTSVSQVFVGRKCFEITFSDGEKVTCDGAHLWTVDDEKDYKSPKRLTLRTEELAPSYKVRGRRNRYAIPVTGPLRLKSRKLAVDPYVLGLWLGDGNAMAAQLTQHEDDAHEIAGYIREAGHKAEVRKPKWCLGKTANIIIDRKEKKETCLRGHNLLAERALNKKGKCRLCAIQHVKRYALGHAMSPVLEQRSQTLHGRLQRLGLIGNKRIPTAYLRASEEQRLSLLQGLMDTDGHITKKGRCEITLSDGALVADTVELIRSLGYKPTVAVRHDARRDSGGFRWNLFGVYYRIGFQAYLERPVFRLKRKAERLLPMAGGRTSETFRRRIVEIREVMSVPVRCISVDSDSRLYLCGQGMIPTHNTEAGLNWIGYALDQVPCPMLLVQPTVEMAKRASKQRIDTLINDCPSLREKVKDPRARDSGNTVLMKELANGSGVLVMTGANSAVGLRSLPAKFVFMDECDAYPGDCDGEGDPVLLAKARARTFARRKILMVSTPTIAGSSRIEQAFEDSDKRRFYVPCPHCGFFQVLVWSNVRWPKGKPEEAAYICEECRGEIQEHHKGEMLAKGRWVAESPGAKGGKVVGFHLSSLYSPPGWMSWADCAQEWLRCHKNPEMLRAFINTILGESYVERGESPDWQRLYDRRQKYSINTVPAGGLLLTAGCDVQRDRIAVEIVAWGRGKRTWSVDYRQLPGDTSDLGPGGPWARLAQVLDEQFKHDNGHLMPIRLAAIDSGFQTQVVYDFVRRYPPNRVIATKGMDNLQVIVGTPKTVEVDQRGEKRKRGGKFWPVGVNLIKSELYGWLKIQKPTDEELKEHGTPPGWCEWPEYGEQYFLELTAEELMVKKVRGYNKPTWVKVRDQNEALDCRVLARACAAICGVDRFSEENWLQLEQSLAPQLMATGQKPGRAVLQTEIPRRKSTFW